MTHAPVKTASWNDEQRRAIEHGNGPLLIIAGAGTGKTTVVTERIKHLISSGRAKPQEILALTFTEKASREMEERVDAAMPYGVTQMWISTFHAFCDRVLRADAIAIGLDPGYRLMTEAETIQMFTDHLFSFPLSAYRPLGNPTKFVRGLIGHFSRLKDEDISPDAYADWAVGRRGKAKTPEERESAALSEELASCYREYEALKVKLGKADYGDLIANTLKLFRARPSILARYRDQFRYILIDEFQDTNWAQNELAVLLAGKRKNITVVGDDDQAIYRWRGAAVANILGFRKRFPKATIVVLTKNYRSTKEILDRSYALIRKNDPDRLEVAEHIDKKLECVRRVNGGSIRFLHADRVENEADAVAREVASIVGAADGKPGAWSYRDVAVLVRANDHAEPFGRAFSRHGIPFQFLGPGRLLRQGEVKDLISYLKVLYDVADSVAMYRVLSMPHLEIPARDTAALVSSARSFGTSVLRAAEVLTGLGPAEPEGGMPPPFVSEEGKEKVTRLVRMIHAHLVRMSSESAGQILYAFLSETGLLAKFARYDTPSDERAALNVAKFFDRLKTYESEHEDAGVHAVVDWLNLSMDLGESPLASDTDWTENDAVNILTVHSAKGLEFPVVFLVNLVSQRFPSTARGEQIPVPDALIRETLPEGDFHMQEERRLFYVGMTRARDILYLTAAKYYGEGKREKKLSPFIEDALGEGVTGETVAGSDLQLSFLADWAPSPESALNPAPVAREVTSLSYSQVEAFHACPLKYKYRYILRIPVKPAAPLSFGDTVHRTLKAFYESVNRGETVSKESLLSLYERLWSSVGYGNQAFEAKKKEQGRLLLSAFYDKGYDPSVKVEGMEVPFRIRIEGDLTTNGRIDRVDRLPDGRLEIIDYKTGTAPKTRDASDDLQLSVYALAATDPGLYGERPDRVIVSFLFLDGMEKTSATATEERMSAARQEIASCAKAIATSPMRPTPGKVCDFCEFRPICEAWK